MSSSAKPDDHDDIRGTAQTAVPLPDFDLSEKQPGPNFDVYPAESEVHSLAETLAAMANTRGGGVLVLGANVQENRIQAGGIDDVENAVDTVLQALVSITPRLIAPMPRPMQSGGKTLVVVDVPSGLPQVYAVKGRYLRRSGAENVTLDPRALRRLFIERGEIVYETEVARGSSGADLTRDEIDWAKAKQYAARMGETDVEELLIKRGCAVREDDTLKPTNAGILLFGKDTRRYQRGAEITAVRFAGETMGDTFNRQDISGTLPEQIRMAETFLRDHLRKGVELKDTMAREERFEYPLEAARELVVNAVAHRDYSIQGDGIRLYLFKDRMEIVSPGLLPGPVTIDNIKDERFSRNPALVQVLADMGFIERLGYGVDRVIELMRQQNLREPQFCETGGGFKVVLYNENAAVPLAETQAEAVLASGAAAPAPPMAAVSHAAAPPVAVPQSGVPTSKSAPVVSSATNTGAGGSSILDNYRDIPLNSRQETALLYLDEAGNTRITNSELQKMHPDVHAETIRRDLSDLVAKNILTKMGEKRGSYYVLKREDS